MSDRNVLTEQAVAALHDSISAVPGDLEHPAVEQIEAFVDGTLDEIDREIVSSHIDLCAQCSEDVADLREVRAGMAPPTIAPQPRRWRLPAAVAAIAATLALIVWLGRSAPPVSPATSPIAAAPAAPAPVAAPADPLSADERALVDRVVAAGRLELPASIADLSGTPGTLLGTPSGSTIVTIAPQGTVVLSARPAFTWQPVKGARAYSVAIFDERFAEVTKGSRISGTTWTPGVDLPRDRMLAWQVTAHLAGSDIVGPAPPQPEARFRVADQATAAAVQARVATLVDQPLERGILLAQAGLIQEAARELASAARNPSTGPTAQRLIASLSSR